MDQLWAPWRLSYVTAAPPPPGDCFICRGLALPNDRENLIACRTSLSTVLLNKFPYNNGHLLIAPLAHKGRIQDLSSEESLDLMQMLAQMTSILETKMKPDGFNIGLNLGQAAGAGLPGHLHWHLVPRWVGDTNFMPLFGDAKVLSLSLDALWQLIRDQLDQT